MMRPDILTHTGVYFNFEQPDRSVITIEDIAHGLSNTCRFAGQCRHFYSVAQHSIYVSQMMPTKELALIGLMHDSTEAYIGDVTGPLKQLLPEYKLIEARIHEAIFKRFGLEVEMPPIIKKVDLRMLATEQDQLMPPHDDEWALIADIEPYSMKIDDWMNPVTAENEFLYRFNELTK